MTDYVQALTNTRYYQPSDINFFTVDNRPLADINANTQFLNNAIGGLQGAVQFQVAEDASATVNAIVAATGQAVSSGGIITLQVANSNSGSCTLALNGDATLPVLMNGAALQGGELLAGSFYLVAFTGASWSILASTAGQLSANSPSSSGHAVTLAALASGDFNVDFNNVEAASLSVASSGAITGAASALASGSASGNAVQFEQLVAGSAAAAAMVNLTNATADQVINPGQAAFYVTNAASGLNVLPLHISCAENQWYEITVTSNYPTNGYINLDLTILANNTSYAGQFYCGGIESASTNQGQFYAPASSTAAFGITLSPGGTAGGFYFDDISFAAQPPYLRTIRLFTGNGSTQPIAVNFSGGGGNPSFTPSTNSVPELGLNLSTSVWDNLSTAYTSLGSLQYLNGMSINTTGSGTAETLQTNFVAVVRRVV